MSGLQLFGYITVFATLAIIVVCLFLYARILSKRHFKCPYCGFSFKAQAIKTFFSSAQGADKLMVCPNCKKSGYMEFKHDEDFDPVQNDEAIEREQGEEQNDADDATPDAKE